MTSNGHGPDPTPQQVVRSQVAHAVRDAKGTTPRETITIRVDSNLRDAIQHYCDRRRLQSNTDRVDAINELLLLGIMTDNQLTFQETEARNAKRR